MSTETSGLQSLASMAHILTRRYELNDLIETAAEHARSALGAATVSISRVIPPGDFVRTVVNVGDLADGEERWPQDETYEISSYRGLATALIERKSLVESIDSPTCADEERALLVQLDKGSSLATAIVVEGASWGEFYATRHVGAPIFDQDAVAYAEVLVAIVAAAVSSSIRHADLQQLAFADPLTGLLNRRALDEHAATLFDLGDDEVRTIAVVAIDINGLKRVNDTEGHASGDRAIISVATALAAAVEPMPSGVVARVGGDEFTVLVSGDDVDGIEHVVNQLSREVSASGSLFGLSAGIASVTLTADVGTTSTEVFAAADRALYTAKRSMSVSAVVAEDFAS